MIDEESEALDRRSLRARPRTCSRCIATSSTRSAAALLEYETLDGQHIKEIMEHGKLIDPPQNIAKPPAPPPLPKPLNAPRAKQEDEDPGGLAPGLAGATA